MSSLTPYRRHLSNCPHRSKGQSYTLCSCPIWAYGELNGSAYRKSLQTTDPQTANQRIDQYTKDPTLVSSNLTLSTALTLFQESTFPNLANGTQIHNSYIIERLKTLYGSIPLNKIDSSLIDRYKLTRKIAGSTWRTELVRIKFFLNWCISRKLIPSSPLELIKTPPIAELVTLPFDDDELKAILSKSVPHATKALVFLLLHSGLRIGDVAKLKRSKLNPNTNHLTLRTLKTGVRVSVLLKPDLVKLLLTLPTSNPEYFFTMHGNHTTTNILRRCLKSTYGSHVLPHRFRDTFAVALLTKGAKMRTVQQLLGHKSIATTEKHYAHFVPEHQALLDADVMRLDYSSTPTLSIVEPANKRFGNA